MATLSGRGAAEKTELMVASVSYYRGNVKAFETAPRASGEVTTGEIHVPGERAESIGAEVRGVEVADGAAAVVYFWQNEPDTTQPFGNGGGGPVRHGRPRTRR